VADVDETLSRADRPRPGGIRLGARSCARGSWPRLRARAGSDLPRSEGRNRKTGRQEGGIGLPAQASQAVLQARHVEVHEEARGEACELELGQDLCFVYGGQPIDSLQFEQETISDDKVEPVPAVEPDPLVVHRQCALPVEPQPSQRELLREARLLSRLEQPGPEVPMHLDASPDHLLRSILKPSCLPVFLFHLRSLSTRPRPELRENRPAPHGCSNIRPNRASCGHLPEPAARLRRAHSGGIRPPAPGCRREV
jgi:hypothetical protein